MTSSGTQRYLFRDDDSDAQNTEADTNGYNR